MDIIFGIGPSLHTTLYNQHMSGPEKKCYGKIIMIYILQRNMPIFFAQCGEERIIETGTRTNLCVTNMNLQPYSPPPLHTYKHTHTKFIK